MVSRLADDFEITFQLNNKIYSTMIYVVARNLDFKILKSITLFKAV